MTQPPDQQPPQGGFGAPQDPPPSDRSGQSGQSGPSGPSGAPQQPAQPPQMPPAPPTAPSGQPGYGYPQGQPGYGYPAAPGQQPGRPGPYAQQPGPYAQQPGPYAAQPGPYGQQPGSYPTQSGPYGQQPNPYGQQAGPYGGYPPQQQYPGGPVPPTGGGGRNPLKGKPGLIIAAAAAALLVIGGGTFLAVSGGDEDKKPVAEESQDGKPTATGTADVDEGDGIGGGRDAQDDLNAGRKDGESKVLFLQTNDVDLPRNGADVYGPWFAGDTVVKAMYRQIVGYSATDGKKKWTVDLPADLCAAPVAPSADGKIVVAYNDGTTDKSECSLLQSVDLTTGKAGWKQEMKEIGLFDIRTTISLSISGNTVVTGRSAGAQAYSLTDGKEMFGKIAGNCQPFAFTGGPKLIAAESCSTSDYKTTQHQIQELDPATGKAKWTYSLAKNWSVDKVYSVNPLVVSVREREKKEWNIIALNPNGTLRSQLAGGKDTFQPQCTGSILGDELEGCIGVAADANTFYISTEPPEGSTSRTNEVVAFNLNTGKPAWRSKAPTDRDMTPLRMENGSVLVYVEPTYDAGGAVATIAPTGGAPKTIQQHPASTAEIENTFFSSKLTYVDGRFYVTGGRVSASSDAEEKKAKTMMAFGN